MAFISETTTSQDIVSDQTAGKMKNGPDRSELWKEVFVERFSLDAWPLGSRKQVVVPSPKHHDPSREGQWQVWFNIIVVTAVRTPRNHVAPLRQSQRVLYPF